MDDSRELLIGKRYEAALNRSYYAMYHCVQALLRSKNSIAKSHKGAHNAFHKEFILPGLISKNQGMMLKRTFEKRQFSDYDYDEVIYEEAKESFEDAESFVNATVHYLQENNFLQ